MLFKKSLPSPLSILMIVVVIAAICTWIMPAGEYSKLSTQNNMSFVLTTPTASQTLPFTQGKLDSLSIKVSIQKFVNGEIRKPLSVPCTYQKMDANPQGFFKILQAPIKGVIDNIELQNMDKVYNTGIDNAVYSLRMFFTGGYFNWINKYLREL